MDCRHALASQPLKQRAATVDSVSGPEFTCENCPDPEGPGQVEDTEQLNFLLFEPQQVFSDGSIKPESLMQVDYGGLSVLRDKASNEEFEQTISELLSSNSKRTLFGVARIAVFSVRYRPEGGRFMAVYDTPLPGKPHHADIMAPLFDRDVEVGPRLSKNAREVLRKKRLRKLNEYIGGNVVEIAAFRDGQFLSLSPNAAS